MTLAILEAFSKNYITQTTLMVNMPFAEEAVALARQKGFADRVGLHLNLTEGRPLTSDMAACPTFCGDSGLFKGVFPMTLDAFAERILKAEIRAQLEKFKSFGLPLLHCDGHHHAQVRRVIARVLMPLLREYGFQTVRRPRNAYPNPLAPHFRSRLEQLLFILRMRSNSLAASSDVFDGWTPASARIVKRGGRTVEIMVHPGFDPSGVLVDIVDFKNGRGRPLVGILSLRDEGPL
mgnify:FL=1